MNKLPLSDPASANYTNDCCNVMGAGQMGEMNMTASKWFIEWDINSIIDCIINTHHQYAKENAVIILAPLKKCFIGTIKIILN